MLEHVSVGGMIYSIDGKLVKLYGFGPGYLSAQTSKGEALRYDPDDFQARAVPTGHRDFPDLTFTDPQLPYDFDLFYDIKRPSYVGDAELADASFLEMVRTHPDMPTEAQAGSPLARLLEAAGRKWKKHEKGIVYVDN